MSKCLRFRKVCDYKLISKTHHLFASASLCSTSEDRTSLIYPSTFFKTLGLYLWKDDSGVMSSKLDLHSGCLNRDFGVMITKGFLKGVAICLLRMWK